MIQFVLQGTRSDDSEHRAGREDTARRPTSGSRPHH